jgi:uncharacterized protein
VEHPILLFSAGLVAGAMNAAAGGGSFVSLPALIFAGVPSVAANESSTVALFPGAFASAWAYRREFRPFESVSMAAMIGVSLAGGLAGAVLLLVTPAKLFDNLLPWLLLAGSVAFAFGPIVGAWLRRRVHISRAVFLCSQFLLAIYGGYFGGAVGIMMMAAWSLLGPTDIKAMNAAKTLLVGTTNAMAVACFIALGKIWWAQTLVMVSAALIGGYGGASIARRLPSQATRNGIAAFNFVITAVFFYVRMR